MAIIKRVLVVGGDNMVSQMFRGKGYNVLTDHAIKNMRQVPDLVCFTGGSDVSPSYYGEEELRGTYTFPKRDTEEKLVYEKYLDTPKIGICRAGQFLNVLNGGAMWQHVDGHTSDHDMIDLITKNIIFVTSTHHQMMIPNIDDGEVLGIGVKKGSTIDKFSKITTQHLSANKKRIPPIYDTEVVWYEKTKSICFQPHPEILGYPGMTDYFFGLIDHILFQK